MTAPMICTILPLDIFKSSGDWPLANWQLASSRSAHAVNKIQTNSNLSLAS
jgi:hypothetical protein